MTVAELIERLQALEDQNARVVIRGYEGGVDDLVALAPVEIRLNVNDEWYYGAHEINEGWKPASWDSHPTARALHLVEGRADG